MLSWVIGGMTEHAPQWKGTVVVTAELAKQSPASLRNRAVSLGGPSERDVVVHVIKSRRALGAGAGAGRLLGARPGRPQRGAPPSSSPWAKCATA